MNRTIVKTWLERILIGLLFATPFTVLIAPLFPFIWPIGLLFFPYITGKAFFFRIIVELALVVWLLLVVFDRSYLPRRSLVLALSTLLVIVVAVADFFGVNPGRSIWSNFERMEGLVSLVHMWAYFVLLIASLKTERLWNYFLKTSVGVSFLVCLYGLLQLGGEIIVTQGGVRLDTTLGNAAYLGTYLFFNIFLIGYLWFVSPKQTRDHVLYGCLGLLELLILYKTATRGAVIGLLAGALVSLIVITVYRGSSTRLRQIAGTGLIVGLLCVGGFLAIKNTSIVQSNSVLKRFADISLQERTTKSRFIIWGMASEGFKERPILGFGQDNFAVVFNKHYNPEMYDQEPWFDRTHNIFLDWLIAAGALGLLAYLSLYTVLGWYLWRSTTMVFYEKVICFGLLVGYIIQNLFIFDNLTSYILFFMFLAFVTFKYYQDKPVILSDVKNLPKVSDGLVYVAEAILIVVLGVTMYIVNIKPMIVAKEIIDANQAILGNHDYESGLTIFTNALHQNTFGDSEIVEQMSGLVPAIFTSQTTPAIKQTWFEFVDSTFKQVLENNNNDARLWLMYSTFLTQAGQYTQSEVAIDRALALSPNKQEILTDKGSILIAQNKFKEGLLFIKQAFDLEPNNIEARKVYALAAFYSGDSKLYLELVKPLTTPDFPAVDDDRFINLYAKNHDYDKLILVWTKRVQGYPTNPDNRIRLAGAYYAVGDKADSLKVLEQGLIDFPADKDQFNAYIKAVETGNIKLGQ